MRGALLVLLVACVPPDAARPGLGAPAGRALTASRRAPASLAPPALRLPGDVVPASYALDLTVVPDHPSAPGRILIAATVVRPTRTVWLHATSLAIDRAALGGRPARVVRGDDDFIALLPDRELSPGAISIDIEFAAPIDPTRSRGIYSQPEGSDSYAYTYFAQTDARRAFPCFDEPGYKVPWQLTLHVRGDHVALGNAPVVGETIEPGGMKRVELATTRPLPSYLVAFVVGPFEVIDGGLAGRAATPVRYIVPRGRARELGYAGQVTPRVVAALEDYFDLAYPFGKLDVAIVPRHAGTMEHPGLVTMAQSLALIRPDDETHERKLWYVNILAHVLSHYWIGALVTMAWWDDTWLHEALGEWSDLRITEAAEPSWRVRDERVGMSVRAMRADETLAAQPIRRPVTTRGAIADTYDGAITYLKGASIMRMFEAYTGHDAWRDFLRGYLASHAWGNASGADFLASLGDRLGPATAAAMRSFLDQPGAPRITVRPHCAPGEPVRVELTQQRSLPAGVVDPSPRLWSVPVCLRHGDARTSARSCFLLTAPRATFELPGACPAWVIPNADAVGYYRSTVAPAAARALLTPSSPIAHSARPTPAERMMLVEDLRAAVSRDELPLDQLLDLVPAIIADRDDKVAQTVLAAAALPARGLDDATSRAARLWLRKTFGARAAQLGWQHAPGDSDERRALRRSLVPQLATVDPVLRAEATRLADRWLVSHTGIADDLVWPALDVAARHGGIARFERYLAAVRAARDRNEQEHLLHALGSFTDPAVASRALGLVLGSELDLRDTIDIVAGVLDHRETRDAGLAFVRAHLDELLARLRGAEAGALLTRLAGAFCDPEHRAQIAEIVAPRTARIDGAAPLVARALEQSDQCIAEIHRQLPALRRLLDLR